MSEDLPDRSQTVYLITVRGYLRQDWGNWLGGLEISHDDESDGSKLTTLTGTFTDQSALHGLLSQLHTLNLELISVAQLEQGVKSQP